MRDLNEEEEECGRGRNEADLDQGSRPVLTRKRAPCRSAREGDGEGFQGDCRKDGVRTDTRA